jgi:hypothetical protein
MDEAPPAPWSPFPLVELVVLLGLVLIVWAFVGGGDRRGTMLAAGVLLGALGGLELSVREHFAGFRSHSAILAGACTVLVAVPLYLVTGLPQVAILAVGVLTFGLALWRFRIAFKRRSGGVGGRPAGPDDPPPARAAPDPSAWASAVRWRTVIDPTVLFSDIGMHCRNLRQRVWPQRRWLVSRSATVMLSASHGELRITSPTLVSPSATRRLSSARASRTAFARSRACMCCGPGDVLASAFIDSSRGPSLKGPLSSTCVLASRVTDRAEGLPGRPTTASSCLLDRLALPSPPNAPYRRLRKVRDPRR